MKASEQLNQIMKEEWARKQQDRARRAAEQERAPHTTAVKAWPVMNNAAYHGLAGDFVRMIEPRSEADPVALLVHFLGGVGCMVGRTPHFFAEADRHGTNIFAAFVGETAKGRKGIAWGHTKRELNLVNDLWVRHNVEGNLSSGEGVVHKIRDAVKRMKDGIEEIVDEGESDKRLLIVETELGGALRVMNREGNTLSAVLRNAWDGVNLGALTKHHRDRATDPHISILGHVTSDELLRYLADVEAGNGFGNRFLWLCVRRSKILPGGDAVSQQVLEPLADRLRDVIAFTQEKCTEPFRRSQQAEQLWHAVYPELSEGQPGLLGSITARAEAQVMRLAMIYALLDRSDTIAVDHLKAALAVWEYCEASARYIFGTRLGNAVADEILRALRNAPEGLTRTDLRDLFGRNKPVAAVNHALGMLLERNLAHVVTEKGEHGRTVDRWKAGPSPQRPR